MDILAFLKNNKKLFQNKPERLDWPKIYELALTKFGSKLGKFTEFWLNRGVHPENYLTELSDYFLYNSNKLEFEIPNHITSIGNNAFYWCESFTSITIPNSVTNIESNAFGGCINLESVIIGNSITSIGEGAFYNCRSLASITIPDSVTRIGNFVFCYCENLTNINIPDSVTSIGDYAFYRCGSLTSMTIPGSVMYIGDYAFDDCGDKLVLEYGGTKEDWKKIYNSTSFQRTYFTVNCTDGKIVKKKR